MHFFFHLRGIIYLEQPPNFTNSKFLGYVYLLKKSLHGLKQA